MNEGQELDSKDPQKQALPSSEPGDLVLQEL